MIKAQRVNANTNYYLFKWDRRYLMGKIINLHLQYFLGCIVDSKSVRELAHLLADTTKLMDKTGEHTALHMPGPTEHRGTVGTSLYCGHNLPP